VSVKRRLILAALLLLQLAFVGGVVVYWEGGVLDTEATLFVTNYLDRRPFLRQIFDPQGNDFGNYQARELSYVFDWTDARFLDALFRHGVVLLVPLSSLLGSLGMLAALPWAARRAFPGLPATTAALALLVYLSHFVFLSSAGLFYRSGKMLLVPLLLLLAAVVVATAREGEPGTLGRRLRQAGAVFGLACLASLLDRQGFFEVVTIAAIVAVAMLWGRRLRATFAALAAAAVLTTGYNLWLAPALVRRLNGYEPTFSYQLLDLPKLAHKAVRVQQAGELLGSYAQVLLGGVPAVLLAALLVVLSVLWLRPRPTRRSRACVLALAALALAAQGLMLVLMIHRFKPMYAFPDHRLCYYPLVFQGVLLFGLCGVLAAVVGEWGRPARIAVNVALAAMVVANVAAWPGDRARAEEGPWLPAQVRQSTLLKRSLEKGAAEPALHEYYRAPLAVLLARRSAVRPPG